MSKYYQHFNERLDILTRFDSVRRLKILELFQYNFAGFILITTLGYIFNKFFFDKTYKYFVKKHKTDKEVDRTFSGFFILCCITLIETFIILVMLFYIRKILLLIPPIGPSINEEFTGLTTFDSVVKITLIFLFLEYVSGYRSKIELIMNYEFES